MRQTLRNVYDFAAKKNSPIIHRLFDLDGFKISFFPENIMTYAEERILCVYIYNHKKEISFTFNYNIEFLRPDVDYRIFKFCLDNEHGWPREVREINFRMLHIDRMEKYSRIAEKFSDTFLSVDRMRSMLQYILLTQV